jgi:hypothetical protein
LAKQKADATKATAPPLAEKSSKLLKVNETLARRKTKAAKVAAAEREKKKVHDSSPAADLEKRVISKKRPVDASERGRRVTIKEKGPDDDEPSGKKARAIRSRRRMKTSTFCRRLRFSLVHLILREGLRRKWLRSHRRQLWPILKNWRRAMLGQARG